VCDVARTGSTRNGEYLVCGDSHKHAHKRRATVVNSVKRTKKRAAVVLIAGVRACESRTVHAGATAQVMHRKAGIICEHKDIRVRNGARCLSLFQRVLKEGGAIFLNGESWSNGLHARMPPEHCLKLPRLPDVPRRKENIHNSASVVVCTCIRLVVPANAKSSN
jgi:hypothetical protein